MDRILYLYLVLHVRLAGSDAQTHMTKNITSVPDVGG